jgi:hypothetical protein
MNTFVYIDAFNLYFGSVRGTPYKWLDLNKLCHILLPRHEIAQIKYFTARVMPLGLRSNMAPPFYHLAYDDFLERIMLNGTRRYPVNI